VPGKIERIECGRLKGARGFAIVGDDRCVVNIDGVLYEAQISNNHCELTWNDGDVWQRCVETKTDGSDLGQEASHVKYELGPGDMRQPLGPPNPGEVAERGVATAAIASTVPLITEMEFQTFMLKPNAFHSLLASGRKPDEVYFGLSWSRRVKRRRN
jgi:hypothetical protein